MVKDTTTMPITDAVTVSVMDTAVVITLMFPTEAMAEEYCQTVMDIVNAHGAVEIQLRKTPKSTVSKMQ